MTTKITVKEAVKLTGYTRQQVYNLIADGRVKATKRAWEYLVSLKSLTDYCKRQGRTLNEIG